MIKSATSVHGGTVGTPRNVIATCVVRKDHMPIKHAAVKQLRKDRKRHQRNQALRSTLKTLTRQLVNLLREQKMDEARQLLRRVTSTYDRAASKGVIHRNTAARYKSRLAHKLHQRQSA